MGDSISVAIAFPFGLLHGFGFASGLNQAGRARNAIPVALLFFNIGVEAGQLLFFAAVLVAIPLGSNSREFCLVAGRLGLERAGLYGRQPRCILDGPARGEFAR